MTTYQRIRFDGTTVILRDPIDCFFAGVRVVAGYEANKDGDDIQPKGAHQRRRIIEASLITSRKDLKMDKFYATLVQA